MLDAAVRKVIDGPLNMAGRGLAHLGVSANGLTVTGFVAGMAALPAIAHEAYWIALVCLVINRLMDGLDGAVARATRPSDFGGFLDITLDFIFYSGFVAAFAWARPEFAFPAALLVWSFMGTGCSFLAYAIIAAKTGQETTKRGRKSFYYLGGIMEGTETAFFLGLMVVIPDHFPVICYVCAALCWITTATRIVAARDAFTR
ncbi:MAG: CDP-alcohol phosphatidyltransferase family protein [Alphaproteobacteria bacterium]|nr:CDP-alcohol phosphatidyltransferase family protein [Alphaproteobacteria bacterium]